MHSRVFGQLATLSILVTTMVFRGGHFSIAYGTCIALTHYYLILSFPKLTFCADQMSKAGGSFQEPGDVYNPVQLETEEHD